MGDRTPQKKTTSSGDEHELTPLGDRRTTPLRNAKRKRNHRASNSSSLEGVCITLPSGKRAYLLEARVLVTPNFYLLNAGFRPRNGKRRWKRFRHLPPTSVSLYPAAAAPQVTKHHQPPTPWTPRKPAAAPCHRRRHHRSQRHRRHLKPLPQ